MYLKLLNMMAKNPLREEYISNGLIFWLDGINIGDNVGYWTDLKQGIKFEFSNYVTRGTNCFVFSGFGCMFGDAPINLQATRTNYTIEMVLKFSATSGTQYIFWGGTYKNIHAVNANGLTLFAQSNPRYNIGYPTDICTISANYERAVKNLANVQVDGSDYWNQDNAPNAIIGGNSTSRRFKGSIYAIRIYNRNLTLEEMYQNQQTDIARFGIQV